MDEKGVETLSEDFKKKNFSQTEEPKIIYGTKLELSI